MSRTKEEMLMASMHLNDIGVGGMGGGGCKLSLQNIGK